MDNVFILVVILNNFEKSVNVVCDTDINVIEKIEGRFETVMDVRDIGIMEDTDTYNTMYVRKQPIGVDDVKALFTPENINKKLDMIKGTK